LSNLLFYHLTSDILWDPTPPISDQDIIKTNILSKFGKIGLKMGPIQCKQ